MHEITALSEQQSQGYLVQSPAVGYLSELPAPGQIVTPESYIGKITILSTTYRLRLPTHIRGQVAPYNNDLKIRPVAYSDPIFAILPIQETNINLTTTMDGSTPSTCSQDGRWIVRAITDGIFYRRPSPDSLPYIEVNSEVTHGQVLGLVEVMKCFNKITFTGSDFPSHAKLVEVCAKDGEEVKYNQPLFVFA